MIPLPIAAEVGDPGTIGIVFFFAFIVATIGIAYWAASRTRTASEFYAAGGQITGVQNGIALAGDYMSAASFQISTSTTTTS